MTHYPFPDSRGTKIALAAFFTAMLFLARDSMFTTAVIGFEKAQFLMLGVICLLPISKSNALRMSTHPPGHVVMAAWRQSRRKQGGFME